MNNINNDCHILILGSPRSGTTLLSAMIGCHPDIAILNEDFRCNEFKVFSKRIRGNKLCIPNQIELVHSSSSKITDTMITFYQRATNKIRKRLQVRTPIPRSNKARLSIREYEKATQDLKIIGIIRSPKDVIDSISSRGQQTKKTSEYRWRRAVEVLYELLHDQGENTDLSIIHFDRLVTSPDLIMKNCLEKMNCEFDKSVLQGFLHTPQYKGRNCIDKSKAGKGMIEDLEHPLLKSDTELARKYSFLATKSL